MTKFLKDNPFQITTPEGMSAEKTVSLFVDVFTDFQKIIDPGHVFLMGPRGSGKSMMFRYLQPDCQCLAQKCALTALPFLGLYIPLKETNFSLAELQRLEHRHASDIFGEHILVTHFAVKIFKALAKPKLYPMESEYIFAIKKFYNTAFLPRVQQGNSFGLDYQLNEACTIVDIFTKMADISEVLYQKAFDFAKRLAFRTDLI